MPPPSPRPACSSLRRRVRTWVSTERGPPLNGGQAMRSSSLRLRTMPGGISRAHSSANSRGLSSTGWSLRVTCRSSRCTSRGPTQTRSCRPLPLRRSSERQRAASSSRPKGLRSTSSAPASSSDTTGSEPERAVSTITGQRNWPPSLRAVVSSSSSAATSRSGVSSSHNATASAAVATAAARWPSWRRRWASTVRRVGCGSTTNTRFNADSAEPGADPTDGGSNRFSLPVPRLSIIFSAQWYQALPCQLSPSGNPIRSGHDRPAEPRRHPPFPVAV